MSSKLKKVRESAKQELPDIEAIKPMVSYSLVLADKKTQGGELVNTLLINHILKINKDNGYAVGKNIIRKYIEVSDLAKPTDKSCVLSKIKRKEKEFINLDVDNQFVSILLEVLQVDNQGLRTYAKRNLTKKSLDTAYYYITILNQKAVNGTDFDLEIANDIVKDKRLFESSYWFKDKYLLVVSAISSPTKTNIVGMFKMFKKEDMGVQSAVGFLIYVAKDNPPEYMKEDVEQVKTVEFAKNMQLVLAISIETDTLEKLFFRLIGIIR